LKPGQNSTAGSKINNDYLYTDTAYTERYMGFARSNDNYRAYDVSLKIYKQITGFRLCLKLLIVLKRVSYTLIIVKFS